MTVYYLPIEPLNERYTEQWYRWFPEEFARQGLEYVVLDGDPLLQDEIKVGTFLDINSTLHYKAEQLKRVADLFHRRLVKAGDCFFVADIEFFGIEAIRYLSVLNNISVKLVGFAHAGSYTRGDFMEPCIPFARVYERGWGEICDVICVGSEYHRECLITLRLSTRGSRQVVVTGNPYFLEEIQTPGRSAIGEESRPSRPPLILHSNRPDPEKNPGQALYVFSLLSRRNPEWRFAVCTSRKQWASGRLREDALGMVHPERFAIFEGLSKNAYLDLLSGSSVMLSCSSEENFGYCILEAAALGCMPVLKNCASHPELLGSDFADLLYDGTQGAVEVIERAVANPCPTEITKVAEKYRDSLSRIVALCRP